MSLVFYGFMFFISFLVVILLKILSLYLSESTFYNREDYSSYECGFEHNNLSRIPFSLRYFLLTLVFLLFDLEIVLLLFMPSFLVLSNNVFSLTILFLFLIILFLGLIYEWSDGSLEWVN